jgi:hypothetical protein
MLKMPHIFLLLGAGKSKSGHYLIKTVDADVGKVMSSFYNMLHSFHNSRFQSTSLLHPMQFLHFLLDNVSDFHQHVRKHRILYWENFRKCVSSPAHTLPADLRVDALYPGRANQINQYVHLYLQEPHTSLPFHSGLAHHVKP